MKLITIGNDPKLFEEGSAVYKRQVEYGKIFDELHAFSRTGGLSSSQISENVFVHPFSIREISKLISQETVVSTQDPFEHGLIGAWLKFKYGTPLHVQLHTDFNNKHFLFSSVLNFIRFFIAYLVLPYADSVRTVSERVKRNIKEMNKNISVLPIRTDYTLPKSDIERIPFSILTVSRLEKEKDIETAIKVFAMISKKFPEAVYTIAGEGSQKNRLQDLARELGVAEKVSFVGWVHDPSSLYASHEIYLSTSLFEGFGMSMIEGALAGCALVLSDAGVALELPSLTFPVRDQTVLFNNLEKLFSDRDLLQSMGEHARVYSSRFQISNEKYLELYKADVESAIKNNVKKGLVNRFFYFVSCIFDSNRLLRFIVAGCTAAFSQIFLLFIFTEIFGIWYLYSSILSFLVALVISFILQKFWAFRDREITGAHVQFVKYTLVAISGLLLNTFLMYVLVAGVGFWYIIAQFVSGIVIAVHNFVLYRIFIFK